MFTLLAITAVQWYGVILLAVGLLLRFIVAQNRFNRRGVGGLQQFSSYPKALAVSSFEGLLKFIGFILILTGLFLYAVEWYNKSTAEKFRQQQLEQHLH